MEKAWLFSFRRDSKNFSRTENYFQGCQNDRICQRCEIASLFQLLSFTTFCKAVEAVNLSYQEL